VASVAAVCCNRAELNQTMLPTLARVLACLLCRRSLDLRGRTCGGEPLRCDSCGTKVPVFGGFVFFPERDIHDGGDTDGWLGPVLPDPHGQLEAYAQHLAERARRGLRDRYAAFRPFNESSRTFLSFLPLLRRVLRPGDLILDTWNRSGWTGDLLAGLFPEQQVVSVWEGDRDVLGTRGFRYWLSEGERADNLDVVFTDLRTDPLPFRDGTFAFVHGLDTLHRYPLHTLVPELLRVTKPGAPILLPHVHLTNSEPEPFFERGERQLHGTDYRRRLGYVLREDERVAVVLGERSLFEAQRSGALPVVADEAETADYNALVGVVPPDWVGARLAPEPGLPADAELADAALLPNPLVRVDPGTGELAVDDPDDLLPRHPVYAERLTTGLPPRLDPRARQVVAAAGRGATPAEIAGRLGVSVASLRPVLEELRAQELVGVHRLSAGCRRLQRYHASGALDPLLAEDDLPTLWRRAVRDHGERPYLVDDRDGSVFTYADADALVGALSHRLAAAGLEPGERVAFWGPIHPEAVLLFWAAAHRGLVFAALDPDLPDAAGARLLGRLAPRLALVAPETAAAARAGLGPDALLVGLDAPEAGAGADAADDADAATTGPGEVLGDALPLSAFLSDDDFAAERPAPAGDLAFAPGAVLFTSGTTGAPRGVVLEQQALARSGRLVAEAFGWGAEDVLVGLGDLHVMSGLRNPCVAAVYAGAAVVVADAEVRRTPHAVAELLARRRGTILATVPAALRALAALGPPRRPLRALRQVLTTAAPLAPSVRAAFEGAYGVAVRDYYGLTETAGLCAAEPPREPGAPAAPGGIGGPVGALFRLVGADGRDVAAGEAGELWVSSTQLMSGYLDEPAATAEAFVDGWYRTGDLARRLPDGGYALVGRLKDVFKNAAGEVVAASAVEEALRARPGVLDAGVVVGRDAGGERLDAYVVLAVDGADGGAADRERRLAELHRGVVAELGPGRAPTRIHCVDRLARNANGKLRRQELSGSA